jgi:hypothetical protein
MAGTWPRLLLVWSQRMEFIAWGRGMLLLWSLESLPSVDDLRPVCCRGCRHPARVGDCLYLWGHGVRERDVVVLPALGEGPTECESCWVRRYLCIRCRCTQTVLPRGMMPHYLYSMAAIVMAFVLTVSSPLGLGLSDWDAYIRQGMYGEWASQEGVGLPYRWRSLSRWSVTASTWWSSWATGGPGGALVDFRQRAEPRGLQGLLEAAVDLHVQWGGVM